MRMSMTSFAQALGLITGLTAAVLWFSAWAERSLIPPTAPTEGDAEAAVVLEGNQA